MTAGLVFSLDELSVRGQSGLPVCERIPRIVEAMVYKGYRLERIELNAAWYRELEAELSGSHSRHPSEGLMVLGKLYVPRLVYGKVPCTFWFESVIGEGVGIVRSDE